MLEADARTKTCPIISRPGEKVLCDGSGCVWWVQDNTDPVRVRPADRQMYDDTGWSTNGVIDEDGKLVFYRAPSGSCAAGRAP